MNAQQIEQLSAALDDGNNGTLYWKQKGSNKILRVESIDSTSCSDPTIKLENKDWFYLNVMDFDDFYLVRPVSDLFE